MDLAQVILNQNTTGLDRLKLIALTLPDVLDPSSFEGGGGAEGTPSDIKKGLDKQGSRLTKCLHSGHMETIGANRLPRGHPGQDILHLVELSGREWRAVACGP